MDENILANARIEQEGEVIETIQFPKSAVSLFREMRRRHHLEINIALQELYEELGIKDRLDNQQKTGEVAKIDKGFKYIDFIMLPKKERNDGKESGKSVK